MAAEAQRRIQLFSPARSREDQGTRADYVLMAIVGALVTVGLVTVYSVSFGPNLEKGSDPFSLIFKHAIWLGIGVAGLVAAMRIDYHRLQRFAVPMMVLTLLSLVGVLFFGKDVQGARRWFIEGSFQPGELAKIVTVVYIAAWVTSKGTKLRHIFYGLVPFAILVGLVAGLIALEPNYSTSILIALTAVAMFFIAGADLLQFSLTVLIGGTTAVVLLTQSHRAMERLSLVWTDVFKVSGDQFWQLEQMLLALASGGIFGKGPGTGGGQYGYVPLAHSDGIFAIWGEETGLVGTWLLLGLILALAYRGFRIASKAPDDFGRVLAAGVTFWLTFQAFINIGVVAQLLPLTGQPLPFISYGGSSLVISLAGIGLLLSISRGKPLPVVIKSAPRVQSAPRPASGPRATEKKKDASFDYGWRDRRSRLSTVGRTTKPRRRPRTRPDE